MKKNHLLVTMKRICQLCSWLMMKQKRTSTEDATRLGSKYVTFYACKKKFICILFFCNHNFPFQWYKERLKPNPSSSNVYHVYWPWIHVMASPNKVLKSFILYCKNFGRFYFRTLFLFEIKIVGKFLQVMYLQIGGLTSKSFFSLIKWTLLFPLAKEEETVFLGRWCPHKTSGKC